MDDEQQRALLQASKLVHARWYESGYPDVAQTGMHPIDHYLRIGAALGRNPSSRFDTRFYLNANPSARASCLNPLVHYLVHGRRQGLPCLPEGAGGAVDGGRMNAPPRSRAPACGQTSLLGTGLDRCAAGNITPDRNMRACHGGYS